MKNWKYIEGAKAGNETLAAHPDSAVAQEIYKIYLDNGKDENKALEVLASKYKNLPKEALKKHLKDAIKAYANIVRNSKAGNIAADITTDGNTWFVTTSDGKKKEFPSEREAEAYVKKIKTGNDTPLEYAHRKPKVINEDKTGAEEFFKQLSDDVKEREEKDDADIEKVGNSLIGKTVWVKKSDGHQYKATVLREDGGRVYVNTGDGDQFWRLKHEVEVINKVGNFKTGKSALKPGDRVQSYGVQGTVRKVEGENSDNIYGEPIIEVEWDNGTVKKVGEHYLRKIGNKVGNSKWELPDGSTATVEDDGTIKIKKQRDSSIYITKLWDKERAEKQLAQKGAKKVGNLKVGNQSYKFYGEVIDIAKTDTNTLKEILEELRALHEQGDFQRAIIDELRKRKVGNSKTGNSTWYEPRRMPFQPRSLQYAYEQAKKKGLSGQKLEAEMLRIAKTTPHDSAATESEMRKDVSEWVLSHGKPEDFVNNKQTGNEAPDDKFAYVMREFDEGKLKTPDGKVVTDPAQAKAIAYSESKKTENGLARARRAMNAWNSERKIEPVGKYREFIRDLKNAIMLDVAAVTYNNVDEQTLKSWVEQAKKEGFGSAIKGVQGKKVILDVY